MATDDEPGTSRTEPLNFRVTATFKKRFKMSALEHELKLYQLLEEAFAAWEEKQDLEKNDNK